MKYHFCCCCIFLFCTTKSIARPFAILQFRIVNYRALIDHLYCLFRLTSLTQNCARKGLNILVLSTERTLLQSIGVQKAALGPIFGCFFFFFLLFFWFYSFIIFKNSLDLHITTDFKKFWRSHNFSFTEILLKNLIEWTLLTLTV